MTQNWTDRIVGARMAVDAEFEAQIEESDFSRQQWGLVMSATEFEIEQPGTPESATLIADTEKLPAVLGELESIDSHGSMGTSSPSSGGILETITSALRGGDDTESSYRESAERLTDAYATALQRHLVAEGRWTEVCALAGASDD
ncbi:DUF5799 family protein [Halocatena halophila]|uniref:DUF5799 family protein n=1 Tax=Halocatena halophila TaxID=2814576 RepID=UPI002ED39838